jgi:UDP-N-acetylglucosamine transferase subunit ALG13
VIFVTLGTHQQPFARALDLVAELEFEADVLVQYGATPARSGLSNVQWVEYLEWDALTDTMRQAEVVISHAGVGSTITAIRAGKKPVVVPRLARFGEHVDDHQLQFAQRFAQRDLALVCGLDDNLLDVVEQARASCAPALATDRSQLQRAVAEAALGGRSERRAPVDQEPGATTWRLAQGNLASTASGYRLWNSAG